MRSQSALLTLLLTTSLFAADAVTLKLERKIELPGVEGRIDHLALDPAGERLFVAAIGNNSVESIDLKAGQRSKSLPKLDEAQGVAWVAEPGKLYVACGGDGAVHVFDGTSLAEKAVIHLGDDADNVRYAPATKQVLVGYGSGAIAQIDPAQDKVIGEIKVTGHPESFQADSSGKRVFVNVPPRTVEVLDAATGKRTAEWKLVDAGSNFPMAFDESSNRVFIGCRSPAKLLVLAADSGKLVAKLEAPGDADDVFFDAKAKLLYATGGDGQVYVYTQAGAGQYTLAAKLQTAAGARTSLLAPDGSKLYVAVPHRGGQAAEIRVYVIER